MRALQQTEQTSGASGTKPISVTVVSTAGDLQEAIRQGIEHIELRRHIDLRELALDAAEGPALLGNVPASVKSLQACPVPTSVRLIQSFISNKLQESALTWVLSLCSSQDDLDVCNT